MFLHYLNELMMKNRVGLGTFPLAGVFSKISKAGAKGIVRKFIDEGGYYIDTAPLYGFGEVEELLGEVLGESPRNEYFIATKCGYIDVEGKSFQTVQKSGKYEDVIRECEKSLQRLNLDFVDLYFVHSPNPNTPFEETMRALVELKKQGKIKEIGVSNVNLEELKAYNQTGHVKYVQNRFSLLNRSINLKFAQYLTDNRIGLVPYQVIDGGQLTGKVFEGIGNLDKEDFRLTKADWNPQKLNIIGNWVRDSIAPIAKELGITIGQLSIAWALHHPYMSFVIVGATNPNFIPINLKANNIVLPTEIITEIDEAYAKLEDKIRQEHGLSLREFRGLNEKYY